MKKMLSLLVLLSIILIIVRVIFNFVEKGHEIDYVLISGDNEFKINEISSTHSSDEDSYYFNIEVDGTTFGYQVFDNYNYSSRVVSDIKYYKGDTYTCILPIFNKDNLEGDFICKDQYGYYNYSLIAGMDSDLDSFVDSIDIYDKTLYNDNGESTLKNGITLYDTLDDYVSFENYRGVYRLNDDNILSNSIFDNDVYKKDISGFVGKYYVSADYNEKTKFNVFYLINVKSGEVIDIEYDYDITMNSYAQGTIGDSLYVFDRDTLIQYEINVDSKTITQVGNENTGIKYYSNNEFSFINAYDAKNTNIYFNEYTYTNELDGITYDRIDKTGIENSGYYYLYLNNGNGYTVYRADIQDTSNIVKLFSIPNLNNILYYKDYIYYKDGNSYKVYNDSFGIKTIFEYDELQFNLDIKIGIYKD